MKYRFINEHRTVWGVMTMCRVLCVVRAGFYAWLHNPVSARDKDNQRLLTLIRDSYSLSGGVYGYRRVHGDLNEIGETCGKNRVPSMSRCGNCWDNAVAESFFSSLKKERIRKRIYKTRDLARADIFDYIEVFYNRARRHSHLGGVSPEAFEQASS
ncbi:TPA: hypothetical protein MIH04_23105 [Klebsiella pneumoniae]|nr:hypothetical protein [Klebsiella pneumoniae]HBX7998446.1 hypothetical protein [Klebsiella pneumoniae]